MSWMLRSISAHGGSAEFWNSARLPLSAERQLLPAFGDQPIDSITTEEIERIVSIAERRVLAVIAEKDCRVRCLQR